MPMGASALYKQSWVGITIGTGNPEILKICPVTEKACYSFIYTIMFSLSLLGKKKQTTI